MLAYMYISSCVIILSKLLKKGTVFPVYTMKAHIGSTNMAALILDLCAKWSKSCPSPLCLGNITGTQCIGGWVVPEPVSTIWR